MANFADLKNSRKSSFEKLNSELSKLTTKTQSKNDDRFWSPVVDKAGNGFAVIRFLPPVEGEDVPFVRMWDHGFQGPGGWYIENSRNSIGEKDPVAEYNSKLWNSTTDDESPARKQARKQKRRLHYVSNIYIVKDSANPENEGKVFLYKYGKKIFDKLNELMNPQFEDEDAVNPFDFWEGASFKLKIRNVEGYRNYDKSEFDKPSPLANDDEELEAIWKQQHKLQTFLDPANFKSYADLEKRLQKVLGLDDLGDKTAATKRGEAAAQMSKREDAPFEEAQPAKIKAAPAKATDDELSFFDNLADDDE